MPALGIGIAGPRLPSSDVDGGWVPVTHGLLTTAPQSSDDDIVPVEAIDASRPSPHAAKSRAQTTVHSVEERRVLVLAMSLPCTA